MDLSDLIHSDTAKMVVKDHQGVAMNGDNGVMSIEFFGPDTEGERRAYRAHRTALIEAGDDSEKALDAECQFLMDVTKRLNNVIYNGAEVTLKDAKDVYKSINFIRAQASTFVGRDVNFIKELDPK